jgi:hypothetical protein
MRVWDTDASLGWPATGAITKMYPVGGQEAIRERILTPRVEETDFSPEEVDQYNIGIRTADEEYRT